MTGYHLELTRCPEPSCGALAEVVQRWTLGSTSGSVAMAQVVCLHRHTLVLPTTWLPRDDSPGWWTDRAA